MNQRLNLRSLRFNLSVTRWASLALPLAFSAVIGLSAPARGDVVWETGPFCDGCTLTNIVFVSVDDFDAYTNAILSRVGYVRTYIVSVSNHVVSAVAGVQTADAYVVSAMADMSEAEIGREYLGSARDALGTSAHPSQPSVLYNLNTVLDNDLPGLSARVDGVEQSILAGASSTRAQVATACESGEECCCQCPDYTSYLQTIISSLASIESDVSNVESMIFQWNRWLIGNQARGILPFSYNFVYGLEQFYAAGDANNAASYFANDLGVAVSNVAFTVSSLQGWARNRDIWSGTFDSAGDFYAEEDNALAKRLSDVWTRFLWFTEPDAPADFDNPYILGWRDFMTLRNVHPTNTADNALWVRGDGDDGAIAVSGTVDFDEDALRDLLQSLEFQIKNSLSQPSLHVTIDNTNDFVLADNPGRLYENVVNNSTTINNIASEVQGQQAEYEDPDWTLDDYGSLFDLRDDVSNWDFVGKWSKMFEDLSIEPPGPCKLWDGYAPNSGNDSGTPGPWGGWSQIIDIQSLYWYPMESCGGLIRSIRGVFRALWTITLLIVIAGLVRINWLLARCGVRILIAVVSAFAMPDPMGAIVEVFETVLKSLSQLYTGLFGGRPAESD